MGSGHTFIHVYAEYKQSRAPRYNAHAYLLIHSKKMDKFAGKSAHYEHGLGAGKKLSAKGARNASRFVCVKAHGAFVVS
jgi:hypothetical protein